jgi:hypothetical protein
MDATSMTTFNKVLRRLTASMADCVNGSKIIASWLNLQFPIAHPPGKLTLFRIAIGHSATIEYQFRE